MVKIYCKKCGAEIEIEKDTYNALLSEIEKEELKKNVEERVSEIEKRLKTQNDNEKMKISNEKDQEISNLNNQIKLLKIQTENEKNKINNSKEEEINNLKYQIQLLNEKIKNNDDSKKLEILNETKKLKDELYEKNNAISELKNQKNLVETNSQLEIQKLKEQHKFEMTAKEEEIQKWKDFRLGDSTKDLGESLEKYCHDKYEEIRSYAFPGATFEKDNEVDEEGKGDFIFRDFEDGIETVSIMFEMKNENDETKTKHKNEDFFAKLDRNRNSKKCEYAVLVSKLEQNSDLYNSGIVDVSHKYPKMFVIRPHHFIAIIGLIRNMARSTFAYKKQLIEYQKENIDITKFEDKVKAVATIISNDYNKAEKIYSSVDDMCDGIIKKVEAFRKEFRTATDWIQRAKNQLPDLEVRKLTYGNKTMKEKFNELNKKIEEEK